MKDNLKGGNPTQEIEDFHEKVAEGLLLPRWLVDLKCPFCDEPLTWRSFRNVNFRLNARNFGDLSVEFLCNKCSVGDTLYFRKEFCTLGDIVDIVVGNKKPASEPVIEEDMYKLMYNNLFEMMISQDHPEIV